MSDTYPFLCWGCLWVGERMTVNHLAAWSTDTAGGRPRPEHGALRHTPVGH